ncbi:MAG: hypothetical protein CR954_00585 [Candidatus Moraniibacteriota bacterium]|nr:MAG: hypothetical protein CR954_00585 [Candidatus Moranbacteria bacterium]
MNTQLAKDIIATITYYDVLDYPLTLFEIWKYRICAENGDCHAPAPVSLEDIATCCRHRSVQKYVSCRNGMYVLCGREHLISVRKDREIISLQKIKKLRRMIAFLRISPFVRMVCVTGRLAYNNCEKDSDLDVLIVYEKGHIWTGRFLMTVLAHVCGVRRHGKKTTDRLCLNYHVTTASLEVPTQDLFGAHEYAWTFPVFDAGDIFAQFCAKNMWIAQYKPQYACEDTKSKNFAQ